MSGDGGGGDEPRVERDALREETRGDLRARAGIDERRHVFLLFPFGPVKLAWHRPGGVIDA